MKLSRDNFVTKPYATAPTPTINETGGTATTRQATYKKPTPGPFRDKPNGKANEGNATIIRRYCNDARGPRGVKYFQILRRWMKGQGLSKSHEGQKYPERRLMSGR